MTSRSQTVLVAEDEWIVARDIRDCLESAGFRVLEPVRSGREAVEKAAALHPDVVVMDVRLADELSGLDAADEIQKARFTPVVFLTAHTDRQTLNRAAASGDAFLVKPFAERQLVTTVAVAAARHEHASAEFRREQAIAEGLRALKGTIDRMTGDLPERIPSQKTTALSTREREIAERLARGGRVTSVAREFGLSTHTVRNHLRSIFRKLAIHSQRELVEYWHRTVH